MIENDLFRHAIQFYFSFSIYYYFAVNSIYLVLLLMAIGSIRRQMKARLLIDSLKRRFSVFAPGISVLAPAFNEESTIVESIKSFLMLDYPRYEIIVINDGSSDNTLDRIKESFMLEPDIIPNDARLSKTEIRGTYRSRLHPNLIVIDKANGGKADALNVGIGFSKLEIFCAVDSDSILETDALTRVVVPFIEDPQTTIASGGTIRIANGSKIRHGRVVQAGLPDTFLPLVQVIEYTRAFLCGRIGWNAFNATLVISGAFGLFSKSAIQDIGGYLEGSIGEDMELIVRIHRHYRKIGQEYRVVFVPDPVCWTEAPESIDTLHRQRNRWQRGLADTMVKNRDMLFNFKFGFLGMVAIPYFFIVEMLGPVIEVLSYICLTIGLACGIIDQSSLLLFLLAGFFYGIAMNIAALLMAEIYFSKYPRLSQFLILVGVSFVEAFGYRQINLAWRLEGLFDYCRGRRAWGKMQRVGFSTVETLPQNKPSDDKQAS